MQKVISRRRESKASVFQSTADRHFNYVVNFFLLRALLQLLSKSSSSCSPDLASECTPFPFLFLLLVSCFSFLPPKSFGALRVSPASARSSGSEGRGRGWGVGGLSLSLSLFLPLPLFFVSLHSERFVPLCSRNYVPK